MSYQHGIDRVELADRFLRGKRIGLITNHTGLDSKFRRSVDILNERYGLIKLFAPEHGLDGIQQANAEIDDAVDEKSGLPVLSLFGKNSAMDLSGLDIVAYDIQDVGLRFFSYISFLALAMKECAKAGIPMLVFDRYDPLGLNQVSGTVLEKKFSSFVGMYEIPSQYGLTVGEYAKYINTEEGIGCELHVIPCADLSRSDDHSTLGLEWIQPSPNAPTIQTIRAYVGTVVFEGTNVSEGRGTTRPFEFIGAPWINDTELAREMNDKDPEGVVFRPIRFMPVFSKYQGECCRGVQIHIKDPKKFDSFRCGLTLMDTIRKKYPEFKSTDFLEKLLGTDAFNAPDFDCESFIETQRKKIEQYLIKAQKYYLY